MHDSGLRDAVETQRRELRSRLDERYIQRRLGLPIRDDGLIKVILGPRRCGKSFLAMHLLEQFGSRGYLNFDDERLVGVDDYDRLVAAVNSVYGRPRHLLLNEIQNLPRWELFANRLQRQGFRLILTGSNAHLLSGELATHLTGRHLPVVLFPFSFAEALSAVPAARTGPELVEELRRYAADGGYPEPLLRDMDRGYYLRTLWDSVLYKDIVRRRRIRSVAGIEDLAGYLLANVSREYSLNRLTSVTRCKSVHTVAKYIGYLEEAFLFFSLSRISFKAARSFRGMEDDENRGTGIARRPAFSDQAREQATANRKIYCIDNGMITARGVLFSPDTGRLVENLVAVALRKRALDGTCELFFWKDAQQREVDFVIKEGRSVTQLIQVCWDLTAASPREREVRALLRAGAALSCERLLVLTADTDSEEVVEWYGRRGRIRLLPVWRWLSDAGLG